MSWTEIKHSVNSDLHKPLNELIEEKIATVNGNPDVPLDELIQTLLSSSGGEKAYTPSDNLCEVVLDEEITAGTVGESFNSSSGVYVGRWIPKHSGTVALKISTRNFTYGPNTGGAYVRIFYNGLNEQEFGILENIPIGAVISMSGISNSYDFLTSTHSGADYVAHTQTIPVQKGDPMYFILTASSSGGCLSQLPAVNSIKIYADEVS